MAREIEAKFVVPDAKVSRRLKRLRRLAGFRLGDRRVLRVLDTYLDTKDRSLLTAGVACRVRRQDDGQVWLTLKEMGVAKGAIHRREELELPLPADGSGSRGMFAVRGWPEGPVRSRVLQMVGRKRLIRLATVRQRRTIRPVAQDGHTVALLSLDDVQVRAGGGVERFSEVEVELTGGGGDGDLNRLATNLEREWGLRPETRSKLERAVALADARPRTPASRKGLGIDPAAPMAEAARRILRKQLARMVAHERGTREGRDIEELHDMRVAVRRMRAALRVFRGYLDTTAYKPFRKTLRRTGSILGMVRDLDVFREKAQRYLEGLPEERRSELDPLLTAWQSAHARARKGMLELLDSKAHAQFKKAFARFLATAGAGAPPESDVPLPDRVRVAVPLLVVSSYAAVRAYEGRVEGTDTPLPRLHQLRIAAKGLRYTLEFFREILPTEVEGLIDRIKTLQEHLGNLQDAVVTCGILRDFLTWGTWGDHRAEAAAATGVVVAPGVATYLSVRQAELQRLVKGFPAVWRKVSGEDFRRRVLAVVADL
jgi:CHAD domain-containing protein